MSIEKINYVHIFPNSPVPKERKDYRIESFTNSPVPKERKDYREEGT